MFRTRIAVFWLLLWLFLCLAFASCAGAAHVYAAAEGYKLVAVEKVGLPKPDLSAQVAAADAHLCSVAAAADAPVSAQSQAAPAAGLPDMRVQIRFDPSTLAPDNGTAVYVTKLPYVLK